MVSFHDHQNVLHARGDEELDALIKATISGGGVGLTLHLVVIFELSLPVQVIPHIHKSLLGPKGHGGIPSAHHYI